MTERTARDSESERREEVLYEALDAAAPDAAAWKQGYAAYHQSVASGREHPQPYWDALDATAPDARFWKAGWAVLDRVMNEAPAAEAEQERQLRVEFATNEAVASYHRNSEDRLLVNEQRNVFGVFDGMGGEGGNPAAAAQAASEAVDEVLASASPSTEEELLSLLKTSFDTGREAVRERGERGSTVGTAIKLCTIEGRPVMGVAHAGDTRLFKYSRDTRTFTSCTPDQSHGNLVYNGFSRSAHGDLDEYMVISLRSGDRLMLCSDGITGDYADQFLTEQEFHEAFSKPTPADAARAFRLFSRKDDDKSIIVIDIK